jgi:hypothetical protein
MSHDIVRLRLLPIEFLAISDPAANEMSACTGVNLTKTKIRLVQNTAKNGLEPMMLLDFIFHMQERPNSAAIASFLGYPQLTVVILRLSISSDHF